MYTVETSKHFEKYVDPVSGVETWVLKNEIAPMQQSFYFVCISNTKDGRYLWFNVMYPPQGLLEGSEKYAVCLDFKTDELYLHRDVQLKNRALIDDETGEIYWASASNLYKKGPKPDSPVTLIAKVPPEMRVFQGRVANHMTFSPDKSQICCDIGSGNTVYMTSLDIKTGKFDVWKEMFGGWNHAQFNPVHHDLILYAMDFWNDLITGERYRIERDENNHLKRLWTIKRGQEPVCHKPVFEEASHEWWSADGNRIYYCDWKQGVCYIDFFTGERKCVAPLPARHAYATADQSLICYDNFLYDEGGTKWYRGCATSASFYNTKTGKGVDIITRNPPLYAKEEPCVYHIDPHPRFVFNDTFVQHTVTVLGKCSLGFTKTADLAGMTK
ncbi:hypothetical protein AGMMS49579_07600 [Spirochaetia bacterium]|nr:hypothetical protein AGMMS49579_07600 [Spirochaetia bacterium]